MRRHKIFWRMLLPLVGLFLKIKFGYRWERPKNLPEQYIVLANHTTDFDPLFVGAAFRRQMYFVASEHISRWKHAFKFVNYIFEPIMRYKGTVASSTVMEVLRKTRAGENVCIFAEGGRNWDGVTAPILPSTGKLVKKAGCALVTYKLVGGYFVSPNWSEKGTRRGYVRGELVNVYTKEQLAAMSVEEVNEIIRTDLHEDAYRRQTESPKKYKGKRLAYRMENLAYLCPQCGKQDTLRSEKDTVRCESCGLEFTYDQYGMLHGLPFTTVKELAAWQKEQTGIAAGRGVGYTAAGTLYAIAKQQQELLSEGEISMDAEALRCGKWELPLDEISDMAMHGRHALVFSAGKTYYELIPREGYNTLKFLELFQGYSAIKTEERVG